MKSAHVVRVRNAASRQAGVFRPNSASASAPTTASSTRTPGITSLLRSAFVDTRPGVALGAGGAAGATVGTGVAVVGGTVGFGSTVASGGSVPSSGVPLPSSGGGIAPSSVPPSSGGGSVPSSGVAVAEPA